MFLSLVGEASLQVQCYAFALVVGAIVCSALPRSVAAEEPSDNRPLAELLAALDQDRETLLAAADHLTTVKPANGVQQQALAALQERWLAGLNESHTKNLIALLEHWSAEQAAARQLLIRLLEDDRVSIRQAALEAAVRNEVVQNPRILPLIASLRHAAPEDKYRAANMLGKFGPQAAPAVGALVRAAQDDTSHAALRWEAVYALRDIGILGLDGLIEVLQTTDRSVAYKTLDSLASFGPQADPAFSAVTKALASDDPHIRWRALIVLGNLPDRASESRPLIMRSLSDPDQHVRDSAEQALAKLQASLSGGSRLPRGRFE